MQDDERLSFAYKYPFSKEAKAVVGSRAIMGRNIDEFLEQAKARLEEAFSKGKLEYKNFGYGRLDYIIGYAYARMLVSGLGSRAGIVKYAAAEAARSKAAIEGSDNKEILLLARELGLDADGDGSEFRIKFASLLGYMSSAQGFSLSNFRLRNGFAMLNKHDMAELLESAIFKEILKGLPIKHSDLPQKIVTASKLIAPPAITIRSPSSGSNRAWIDKLLGTPIPDMRHRVVNLILAPYLVNVKGISEDDAFNTIATYVERCRELDPNTKINDSYIKYQCAYAKKRGLKPLSLVRAKELLGAYVNFDLPREKAVEK